jgi:hypothetical protein
MALRVGQSATIQLGIQEIAAGGPAMHWSAATIPGLTLSAESGVLTPSPSSGCSSPGAVTEPLTVGASATGSFTLVVHLQTATGITLPTVVFDVVASG